MSGRATLSGSTNTASSGNNYPNSNSAPPSPSPQPSFPVIAFPLESGPVGPRSINSSTSAWNVRNDMIDKQKIDELWAWMRMEVLDPLEEALVHFDPKATEVVRKKYCETYT